MLTQLCLALCDPMDCSPPGSSAHGILQARILERVAISSSRGSARPRGQSPSLPLLHWQAGGFFTTKPLGKPQACLCPFLNAITKFFRRLQTSELYLIGTDLDWDPQPQPSGLQFPAMDSITSKEVDWVSGITNVLLSGKEGTDCRDQEPGSQQCLVLPHPWRNVHPRG